MRRHPGLLVWATEAASPFDVRGFCKIMQHLRFMNRQWTSIYIYIIHDFLWKSFDGAGNIEYLVSVLHHCNLFNAYVFEQGCLKVFVRSEDHQWVE